MTLCDTLMRLLPGTRRSFQGKNLKFHSQIEARGFHVRQPCRRFLIIPVVLVAAMLGSQVWPVPPSLAAPTDGAPTPPGAEATDRLREGTRLDGILGTFRATGDRWTFFTGDGARRFGVLENLALERVSRTIRENSQAVEWSISGVITEHQGVNYLLVTRAVLKTRLRQP